MACNGLAGANQQQSDRAKTQTKSKKGKIMSEGDPSPTPDPTPAPTPDPTPTPAAFTGFYGDDGKALESVITSIPEEHKSFRSFVEKYQGSKDPMTEMYRGFESLQTMASQKQFQRPGEGATQAEIDNFNNQMRLVNQTPGDPTGYKFIKPETFPEGVPFNQEEADGYAGILHKHNASPEMAKELFEAYTGSLLAVPELQAQADKQAQDTAMNDLRDEHGALAERVYQDAIETANLFGAPEELINLSKFSAETLTWLSKMKDLVSPDSLPQTKSGGAVHGGGNYAQQADEQYRLATEAHARGDHAAHDKHYSEAQRLSQLDANAKRR